MTTRRTRPSVRVDSKRLHSDFDDTLVLSAEEEQLDALLEAFPKAFFQTDHYAGYPYVLVRLNEVSPSLFEALLEAAWRRYASKKQIAERHLSD